MCNVHYIRCTFLTVHSLFPFLFLFLILVLCSHFWFPSQLQGMLLHVLKFNPVCSRNAKNFFSGGILESKDNSVSSSSHPSSSPLATSEDVGHYNEKTLQYAHFVQCTSMLERLLLYKQGRELFPVKIPGRSGVFYVYM